MTSFHAEPEAIIIRINRRAFNYVTTVAASIVLFFTFTSPYGNPTIDGESRKADTELMLAPRVIKPKVNGLRAKGCPRRSNPPSQSCSKEEARQGRCSGFSSKDPTS